MRGNEVQQRESVYRRAAVSLSIFVLLLLFFFAFSSSRPLAGMLSLGLEPEYGVGEMLTGALTLALDAGELLPADSWLSATLGNQSRIVPLSSVAQREQVTGEYFVAGMNLTGTGAGYGLAGMNTSFPEVTFELFIRKETSSRGSGGVSNSSSGSGGSTGSATNEPKGSGGNTGGSAAGENASSASLLPPEPSAPSPLPPPQALSTPSQPAESGSGGRAVGNVTSESSAGSGSSSTGEQSSAPQSLPARTLHAEVLADIIVGEVNESEGFSVSGSVRAGGPNMSIALAEGGRVSLITGSVKADGKSIDESAVLVSVVNGSARVSTSYSVKERGFGKAYHQEESEGVVLTFKLENFMLTTEESGKLRVQLLYRDTQLAFVEKEVVLREVTAENLTANASAISNVSANLSNQTIVNVNKSGNVTIVTARSKIRVGQPVKWVKNVTLERAQNVTIELPKEAENVSVKKVEKEKGEKESGSTGPENVAALGFFPEGRFRALFPLFHVVEGVGSRAEAQNPANALPEAKAKITEKKDATEVVIADNATQYVIEYVTDAPVAHEVNTSRGKRVVISGPDALNYTDVVSFASVPERVKLGQERKIRIWWEENKSSVPFDAYDTNSNGYVDSVEWLTPHLSNQTFTIIVIVKAEHLDENRTFIGDVYELVRARDGNWTPALSAGHYLRVVFEKNLSAQRDITIYARAASNASNASVHVYEKDKNELLADFGAIREEQKYQILLKNLQGTQDTFDLKIVGNALEFDYVVDPAGNTVCTANVTSPCFFVTNRSGGRMAIFDRYGNLDLRGSLTAGAIGTLEGEAFIIINSSNSVLAWINTSAGNMRILGTFTGGTNTTCTPPANRTFVITNRSGSCFAYINSTLGDLWISANLTQNSTTI